MALNNQHQLQLAPKFSKSSALQLVLGCPRNSEHGSELSGSTAALWGAEWWASCCLLQSCGPRTTPELRQISNVSDHKQLQADRVCASSQLICNDPTGICCRINIVWDFPLYIRPGQQWCSSNDTDTILSSVFPISHNHTELVRGLESFT